LLLIKIIETENKAKFKGFISMNNLFNILMFRWISRSIGVYVRYYFFKIIGKPRSMKSLSNEYKDEYKDFGKALEQVFWNALVGTITFIIIVPIIAWIVFR
jgi:hypothetical protein